MSEPTAGAVRIDISSNEDVVVVRQRAREHCQKVGFTLLEITKLVTAASELARNALEHGGGGYADVELVADGNRRGVQLTFVDDGPGIPDLARALQDGFTTGKGLGLGLGGSKRLVSEFFLDSTPGVGTKVRVIKWR